ncbi:hypothetical protein BCR44DRAFT_1005235 [Catenaria anguillulae PL171]|uniref:Uncharacterized protein n=1 Tax=Catenaria anguillulae PL171 TaxID=765915 RepID=A0A1Y2I3S3_9FUNG|nr:hypothetical protein BCR44DRAFT_1005235 [Catenaria anguillulae PL171]
MTHGTGAHHSSTTAERRPHARLPPNGSGSGVFNPDPDPLSTTTAVPSNSNPRSGPRVAHTHANNRKPPNSTPHHDRPARHRPSSAQESPDLRGGVGTVGPEPAAVFVMTPGGSTAGNGKGKPPRPRKPSNTGPSSSASNGHAPPPPSTSTSSGSSAAVAPELAPTSFITLNSDQLVERPGGPDPFVTVLGMARHQSYDTAGPVHISA